eukprot:GHVQ01037941.1.p1 GENE.GHVQ01037941.1~~GHVQ01037941.1.p1  ORF type:complete len:422 (-),score=64.57 GHVQ01037941.1:333-1433(-)
MITSKDFWEEEGEAPILNRNEGFLEGDEGNVGITRAKGFMEIVESFTKQKTHLEVIPDCNDEAALRIFRLDAERTFKSHKNREQMIMVLQTLWHELGDYHQGLGFIVAVLLLVLPPQDVVNICVALHRHYVPGYYKSAAAAYVRDAKVYWKLVEKFFPHVAEQMEGSAPPEAFCSKWFVGLCVHVLPFKALFLFFEGFFSKGVEFLMQFGLALMKNCEADLMSTKDVSRLLAILRLDVSLYPDHKKVEEANEQEDATGENEAGSFFVRIVEDALNFELSGVDIEALRSEVLEEMAQYEIKRKQREAEMNEYSDDEIVFSDEAEDENEETELEDDKHRDAESSANIKNVTSAPETAACSQAGISKIG